MFNYLLLKKSFIMGILKVEERSLTLKECNQRAQDIFDLLKRSVKELKLAGHKFKLSVSGDYPYHEAYFIGNKIVGSDYELTIWKKVPLYRCSISSFNNSNSENQYFLNMFIQYTGCSSSEDWRLAEFELSEKFKLAIKNCIKDFTETKENTL